MVSLSEAWAWVVDLIASSLSDIAIAAIILFSGLVVARVSSLLIDRGLRSLKFNAALEKGFSIRFNVSGLISQFVLFAVSIVSVLWALRVIGINAIVVTAVSIFAIVVIAFSIVLALRDLIPNFIAGVEISRKSLFDEGDTIMYDGEPARVLEAGLIETILNQGDVRIVIPNAMLLRHEIIVEGASSPIGPNKDDEPEKHDRVADAQESDGTERDASDTRSDRSG